MKKIIWIFCLLCGTISLQAQQTLRDGIVINIEGETLKGQIDYQSDGKLAQQCRFLPEGASRYITYLPGQIQGYRMTDNGRFFLSKEVTIEAGQAPQILFLEALVEGELSLYMTNSPTAGEIYFFEDANGKIVTYQFESLSTMENMTHKEYAKHRREHQQEVFQMIALSEKAKDLLWNGNDNESLVQAVKAYNDDICPDKTCIVHEYRSPKTPKSDSRLHVNLMVGASYTMLSSEVFDQSPYSEPEGYNPNITLAFDFDITRNVQGLMFQVYAGWNRCKVSSEYKGKKGTYKANQFIIQLGPAYEWTKLRIRPMIHAGLSYAQFRSNKLLGESGKIESYKRLKTRIDGDGFVGYYGGLGFKCPTKSGAIIISADYIHGNGEEFPTTYNTITARIGYQF